MTINAITVTPLAVTPYDSIWSGITDQCLYIPAHLLADLSVSDDVADSNSTMTNLPAVEIEGTPAGTGANSGWFTGVVSGDVRAYSSDAAIAEFFRTDTLEVGQSIVISCFVYIPVGGISSLSGIWSWGRGAPGQPGIIYSCNTSERMQLVYADGAGASVVSGIGNALEIDGAGSLNGINHLFAALTRISTTNFKLEIYENGVLGNSNDGAIAGISTVTGGLSIFSNQTNGGAISNPMQTGMRMSDILIARTSNDIQAQIPELTIRQTRMRTSLARKWTDVL